MGLTVKWDITHECNLNCSHCIKGDDLGKLDGELDDVGVKKTIDNLARVGIDRMHLLGGEPTARKDFIDIMEYLDEKQINFGFNTNGLKMSNPKMLDAIVRNKSVDNIIFSIEGPSAELNDEIRGKKVFNVTVKNLKKLIELKREHNLSKLRLTINMVLSITNKDYLGEMIDFCMELGVDELVILQMIPQGNAAGENYELDFNQEIEAVHLLAEKYDSYKDRLHIRPRFTSPLAMHYCSQVLGRNIPEITHGCGAGTNFAYIGNKGDLYPCDRYIEQVLENNEIKDITLDKTDFFKVWSKEEYSELYELTEGDQFYKEITPCNTCDLLRTKCYPCPVTIESNNSGKVVKNCIKYIDLMNDRGGQNV